MGKILLYSAGRACQALAFNPEASGSKRLVHPWKDINGTEYDGLFLNNGTTQQAAEAFNNLQYYSDVTGYISEDTEEDFSVDHYAIREINNISYSRGNSRITAGRVYTIQATNNGNSPVSVGSIKFVKTLRIITSSGGIYYTDNAVIFGYFLDSPVTIGVGETKTFAINLDS